MRRNAAAYGGRQLADAGFSVHPLEVSEASSTPALRLVEDRADGRAVYRYTDPYHCRCTYVGDAQAYAKYQSIAEDDHVESVLSMPVHTWTASASRDSRTPGGGNSMPIAA